MIKMINIMIMITLMIWILSFMIMTIMKKMKLSYQKMSSFECGFNPMSKKRLPFSIHFFLLAVLFLVFDIEIIIIIPMIITMKFSILLFWLTSTMFFILMLIMGLYMEWYNGFLNWTK